MSRQPSARWRQQLRASLSPWRGSCAGPLRLQCRAEEDVFDLHRLWNEPLVVLELEEALEILPVGREAVGPGVGTAEEVGLGLQREAAPDQAREAGLVVV